MKIGDIMPYVLIRSKVKDYDKWKTIFDEHATTRKTSGSKGGRLFRNDEDPNELVIVFKWDSIENARKFAQSEELKKRMLRAGVIDKPDMYFLEEIERLPA